MQGLLHVFSRARQWNDRCKTRITKLMISESAAGAQPRNQMQRPRKIEIHRMTHGETESYMGIWAATIADAVVASEVTRCLTRGQHVVGRQASLEAWQRHLHEYLEAEAACRIQISFTRSPAD